MSYPSAPWNLQGYSLQTLHLIDIDCVRPYIPADLKIFSVLPGKTLGGVYVASYGTGSILEYNELIVVGALLWEAGKIGSWISHIYVDQPNSVAGGREIWGLPKQEAQFTWNLGSGTSNNPMSVEVQDGQQPLCVLHSHGHLPGLQQKLSLPAYGLLKQQLLLFEAEVNLKVHLARIDLKIPADSSFSDLKLGQPLFGFYANPLHLMVKAPTVAKAVIQESIWNGLGGE